MQMFLERAGITSGIAFFIGALKTGEVVVGPVEDTLPPVPGWLRFDRTHEVAGIGTIFPSEGKPSLHLHGSLGRESSVHERNVNMTSHHRYPPLDYPTVYEQLNPAHGM